MRKISLASEAAWRFCPGHFGLLGLIVELLGRAAGRRSDRPGLRQRVGERLSPLPPPVVAMGLIPHIYHHEGLSMGDPRQSCPAPRNDATRFTMFCVIHAELFQGQQPEFPDKIPCSDFAVVVVVLPLQLHTTQAHAHPRVEFLESPSDGCKGRSQVVCGSSYNPVQFFNGSGFAVARISAKVGLQQNFRQILCHNYLICNKMAPFLAM